MATHKKTPDLQSRCKAPQTGTSGKVYFVIRQNKEKYNIQGNPSNLVFCMCLHVFCNGCRTKTFADRLWLASDMDPEDPGREPDQWTKAKWPISVAMPRPRANQGDLQGFPDLSTFENCDRSKTCFHVCSCRSPKVQDLNFFWPPWQVTSLKRKILESIDLLWNYHSDFCRSPY